MTTLLLLADLANQIVSTSAWLWPFLSLLDDTVCKRNVREGPFTVVSFHVFEVIGPVRRQIGGGWNPLRILNCFCYEVIFLPLALLLRNVRDFIKVRPQDFNVISFNTKFRICQVKLVFEA